VSQGAGFFLRISGPELGTRIGVAVNDAASSNSDLLAFRNSRKRFSQLGLWTLPYDLHPIRQLLFTKIGIYAKKVGEGFERARSMAPIPGNGSISSSGISSSCTACQPEGIEKA